MLEDDPKLPIEFKSVDADEISWRAAFRGFDIKLPNGELFLSESFFDRRLGDRCVEYFQEAAPRTADEPSANAAADRQAFANIHWQQEHIRLYGKCIPLPRLTAWYGDSGRSYTYSGITSRPNAWNAVLLHLKQRIEACTGCAFNSVLLNWYRDGEDHINWHSDDERELGRNPTVASANFGATRDFLLRRKDDPSRKLVVPLRHGTLLVMRGELQHHWEHAVPKRKRVHESRFNLTFRRIVSTR